VVAQEFKAGRRSEKNAQATTRVTDLEQEVFGKTRD
jgi:hypothetical protein